MVYITPTKIFKKSFDQSFKKPWQMLCLTGNAFALNYQKQIFQKILKSTVKKFDTKWTILSLSIFGHTFPSQRIKNYIQKKINNRAKSISACVFYAYQLE